MKIAKIYYEIEAEVSAAHYANNNYYFQSYVAPDVRFYGNQIQIAAYQAQERRKRGDKEYPFYDHMNARVFKKRKNTVVEEEKNKKIKQ